MSSWKRASFLFSRADARQPAFPRAEQRRDRDQDRVHVHRHLVLGAERIEIHEERDADEAGGEAERGADEAVADDVERFEVVARMDVLLLQPRLVLTDDV